MNTVYQGNLFSYLLISGILFALGLVSVVSRKNAIGILIGIELILNATILNFLAFWRYLAQPEDASGGLTMAVFLIILAACEAAIALAVLLNLYFNFGTADVDFVHDLKR